MGEYEKPSSMTVKDWLVKKMSLDMMVSESVIHRVVDHQVNGIRKALDTNKSVEASGFGKFIFNQRKAEKKVSKLNYVKIALENIINDPEQTERKIRSAEFKLHTVMLDMEAIKKRVCE